MVKEEGGGGEDIFVLAMDFGIFGYHGTILDSFQLFPHYGQLHALFNSSLVGLRSSLSFIFSTCPPLTV